MRVDIVSIFPEYLDPLGLSLVGKARQTGLLDVRVHDLRDWTHDRHRTVDDTPYGGGAGMVMKPEPWGEALDAIAPSGAEQPRLIVPTPAGRLFDQALAQELAAEPWLMFACGRYEGIDARVVEYAAGRMRVDEISIGDYVLNGGEVAVLAIVESVARLLPGVIGNPESLAEESHASGLLEYPGYTKPASWRGHDVPEVLLLGNHGEIARWRHEQSLHRTAERRPDLLAAFGEGGVNVLAATPEDAGEILTVQRAAYLSEAQAYGDPLIPPLVETLPELLGEIERGEVWKAISGARIVGSVRVSVDGPVASIGRLVVAPDWQGRGVGTQLLQAAEAAAPLSVTSYTLFTGASSDANLRLYERAGYVRTESEQISDKVELVHLTKRR